MCLVEFSSLPLFKHTLNAETVWKSLNGLVGIYKPQGVNMKRLFDQLKLHLCKDLNELDVREPEPYIRIEGETHKKLSVTIEPSFADHQLVVGPRYQPKDFRMTSVNHLSKYMSGVVLIGINRGVGAALRLRDTKPITCFKVKGILGQATDNFFIHGKIIEKSAFKHVKRHHIDMISASLQSSHQRSMFDACGVDIQSQAAYELAVQGLIRPTIKEIPLVYSIKCIAFDPPEFTLEIVCLNTDESYLKYLIHSLGLLVRSNATCSLLQCYQVGIFTTEKTLLKRDWTLQPILDNMLEIKNILRSHNELFNPEDAILREFLASEDTDVNIETIL